MFERYSVDGKHMLKKVQPATLSLPKAILDRIRRYAKEGRELRVVYGHNGCVLLAVAMGQVPVAVLRSDTREQFTRMRSAALEEWVRASPFHRIPKLSGMSNLLRQARH